MTLGDLLKFITTLLDYAVSIATHTSNLKVHKSRAGGLMVDIIWLFHGSYTDGLPKHQDNQISRQMTSSAMKSMNARSVPPGRKTTVSDRV